MSLESRYFTHHKLEDLLGNAEPESPEIAPEDKLKFAVLEQAIEDIDTIAHGRKIKIASDVVPTFRVVDWVCLTDPCHRSLYSVDSIAERLGVSAGDLRSALLERLNGVK